MGEEVQHAPVMLKEAIEFLAPQEGGTYVDCTLGSGGHAREILSLIGPTGRLIGFDKDETDYSTHYPQSFQGRMPVP